VSHLLPQFVRTFDPLKRGFGDADSAELGYAITKGFAFPALSDVIVLMRRKLYPTPELWHYCGQVDADQAVVQNADGYPHEADMGYQYSAALCHASGFRSQFCEPVRVDFDVEGALITPALPMWPIQVAATPIAGGKFKITWAYTPWGQGGWPTDFQVFAGLPMDYGTPLTDSVTGLTYTPYVANRQTYSFTTGAYGDGLAKVFGVRARNSGGTADQNEFTTTSTRARAAAPAKAEVRSIRQRRVF